MRREWYIAVPTPGLPHNCTTNGKKNVADGLKRVAASTDWPVRSVEVLLNCPIGVALFVPAVCSFLFV